MRRIFATASPHSTRSLYGLAAAAIVLQLILPASVRPALATTATVPDDFATIQQAVDSGVDEILVRPGPYFETPVITRPLVLRGLVPSGAPPDSLPVIAGLLFDDLVYGYVHTQYTHLTDLRFSRAVRNAYDSAPYSNPFVIVFSRCVLDSGMNDVPASVGGQLEYEFYDCTFDGPIDLGYPDRVTIESCDVRRPITMSARAYRLSWFTVSDSRIHGAGPVGVSISRSAENVEVHWNTFEGYDVPLEYLGDGATLEATHNTFTGPGLYAIHAASEMYARYNTIEGYDVGFLVSGVNSGGAISDNTIEHCATCGIDVAGDYVDCDRNTVRSCGTGIVASGATELNARGNVVEACVADGMSLHAGQAQVESNIVGHCGGHGIAVVLNSAYGWPLVLEHNTSYLNGMMGYSLALSGATHTHAVDHNIAFGNGAFGLEATGDPLRTDCNDWFGNASGPTQGTFPSPTDVSIDPRFCDPAHGDVHLMADSPVLDAPVCGLIGALGQGCGATAVEPANAPRVSALRSIAPNPASGETRVEFDLARDGWIELDILDVQGRAVAILARGAWNAGTHAVRWDRASTPAPGVYFVRFRFSGGSTIRRVVRVS